MRVLALLALGLLACGKTGTTVVVHLSAEPALSDLTRLHLTATVNGKTREYDIVPPSPTLSDAIDIAIHVPARETGQFAVTVLAFAGETQVGRAADEIALRPGELVTLNLIFGRTSPDFGDPDLVGADLVGADLVGADLARTPDLADGGVDQSVNLPDLIDLIPVDLTEPDLTTLPDLVPPTLVIVPATWSFGPVNEGASSAPKTFTIQNQASTPTGALTVAGNAEFTVDKSPECDLALASLATCTVQVTFNPVNAGARAFSLTATSSSTGHVGSASLSGVAVGGLGDACSADAHCQSGNCVDGFCCNMTAANCKGCYACNVATKEGTCSPVPTDTDPKGACTQACDDKCNGAGACKAKAVGAVCATDPCTNTFDGVHPANQYATTTSGVRKCTGAAGPCSGAPTACAASLVCDTTSGSCKTACTKDTDCVRGKYCDTTTSTCKSGRNAGQPCTSHLQCASYVCHAGTCYAECGVSADCATRGFNNGSVCVNDLCYSCMSPSGTRSCAGSGWGNTCATYNANYSNCSCGSASECPDTAPLCVPTSNLASANGCSCATGVPLQCATYEICVNPGASGSCRLRNGLPCVDASSCASGKCTTGVCMP